MSNENEVYIIEDIHPEDGFYGDDTLIGKTLKIRDIITFHKDGWIGANVYDVPDRPFVLCFYKVKLSPNPNKSFWQKLFTWSW